MFKFILLFVFVSSSAMAGSVISCTDPKSGASIDVSIEGNSLHYDMNSVLMDILNKQMFPPIPIPAQGTGGKLSDGCFYETTIDHDNTWDYFNVGPDFIHTPINGGEMTDEYIEVEITDSASFLFDLKDCVFPGRSC